MNPRRHAESHFLLNALVAIKKSLELRTIVFSETNLDALLEDHPAAITFSPPGALNLELLLRALMEKDELFRPMVKSTEIKQWRYYAAIQGEQEFELKALVKTSDLLKRFADSTSRETICALVPDIQWTSQHDEEIRAALYDVIVQSATGEEMFVELRSSKRFVWKRTPRSRPASKDANSDRETLIRIRKEMLDKVGSYTSEDLASAAASTTGNASQFAADQRRSGKLFGVRFGQAWHYPKFQFDSRGHILPEVAAVLSALTPDEQGWDRLQWFLEPHELLRGHTPLEIWKKDRQKVIEAARAERWNARD